MWAAASYGMSEAAIIDNKAMATIISNTSTNPKMRIAKLIRETQNGKRGKGEEECKKVTHFHSSTDRRGQVP